MNFVYKNVIRVVDSAIISAQIQKECYGFGSLSQLKLRKFQISQALQVQEWELPDRIGVHITQMANLVENYS